MWNNREQNWRKVRVLAWAADNYQESWAFHFDVAPSTASLWMIFSLFSQNILLVTWIVFPWIGVWICALVWSHIWLNNEHLFLVSDLDQRLPESSFCKSEAGGHFKRGWIWGGSIWWLILVEGTQHHQGDWHQQARRFSKPSDPSLFFRTHK